MAQIKYYYNGKLIRTSSHIYTHAVLDENGKCVACRNGLEAAQKAKTAEKSFDNGQIRDAKEAIKMLKAGKSYYFYKVGRCQYMHKFEASDTIEKYEEIIERLTKRNEIKDAWQIVELEAR